MKHDPKVTMLGVMAVAWGFYDNYGRRGLTRWAVNGRRVGRCTEAVRKTLALMPSCGVPAAKIRNHLLNNRVRPDPDDLFHLSFDFVGSEDDARKLADRLRAMGAMSLVVTPLKRS
jgi:hypothetical protein